MKFLIAEDIKNQLMLTGFDAKILKKAIQTVIVDWQNKAKADLNQCELIVSAMDAYANKEGLIKPLDGFDLYKFYYWLVMANNEPINSPNRQTYLRFAEYLKAELEITNITPIRIEFLQLFEAPEDMIERLLNWDGYTCKWQNKKGYYFAASNIEGKIYTGIDAFFFEEKDLTILHPPINQPELIKEYFNIKLKAVLQKQKNLLGELFSEIHQRQNFIQQEIELIKTKIEYSKQSAYNNTTGAYKIKIAILEGYLNWLESIVPNNVMQDNNLSENEYKFINNFDNVSSADVNNYFKACLVNKGYLSEAEFNEYMKAAFENKKPPAKLFYLKNTPTKQKVYTLFYTYYRDIAHKPHNRQKEYVALLGNYFEGYDNDIIQTNWSREYKSKR